MKSSFVKMSKFHPLLTDTLPYEVPVLFSNRGLYETIRSAYDQHYTNIVKSKAQGSENCAFKSIEEFIKDDFFNNANVSPLKDQVCALFKIDLIPYEYNIIKNKDKQRKISLLHPISQIKICDFYAQYRDEILFHTTCSSVSLRHPVKVTSRTFRNHTSLLNKLTKEDQVNCNDPKEVFEFKNNFDLEDIPSNYFVYQKYRHIYAFYISKELLELEQHFEFCFKFDIKRCFDSIYTHSISWAIKGKEYAKNSKNSKETFEYKIDKLMQSSNWGETHGIPIGSEFSRIFAEIILQKIDQEVERNLESKDYKIDGNNIKKGVDFKIRRYVDDFFLFVNSKNVGQAIYSEYEKTLSRYKLFLNEKKFEILSRPFITNITAAKQKISLELKKELRQFHNIIDREQRLTLENIWSNTWNCNYTMINTIRVIIHNNKIEMTDISNLVLSQIKKELEKILKFLLSKHNTDLIFTNKLIKKVKKYLTYILDISFYVFSLGARSNTTYGICKICFEIIEILKKINDSNLEKEIKQQIYSKFLLFFENKNISKNLVEFLDILWVINELGTSYNIPEDRLLDVMNIENNSLSYFEIVVILSYIKNNQIYLKIYDKILNTIESKFYKAKDVLKHAETFMLFFDTINCPYIDIAFKRKILNLVGFNQNQKQIIKFIENKKWFYGWEEKLTLEKLFEIKELKNGY